MAPMNASLDTEVLLSLERRKGEWKRIADESGVSYSWISKFANGHIPNPGFQTLVGLRDYLVRTDPGASPFAAKQSA